jgi:hypothetical protein
MMNRFEKILLTVFFLEIFIGGGGRLIEFGPLSIRQVLFMLLLVTFFIRIVRERAIFNKEINTLLNFNMVSVAIYALLISFVISSVIGYLNQHSISVIVMDFFRVSFFLLYFPLAYYISDKRFSKKDIVNILKYSALIVALFTIVVTVLGKTIFSHNFGVYYEFINKYTKGDLFFRPSNSVFHKSHFFVLIGLVISLNALLSKKYSKIDILNVIFCSISLIWSETRGFLLAFMVAMMFIIFLDIKMVTDHIKGIVNKVRAIPKNKMIFKKMLITLLLVIAVPFLYKYMTLERFGVDTSQQIEQPVDEENVNEEINDVSVNARMDFILDSLNILKDPVNLIIGTGYGQEIAGRVNGIEMSFLDILVEQGLIGLSIWGSLFLLTFLNYHVHYKIKGQITTLDVSLLAAFVGALLLTNINPFINNPIGISFFLILLVFSLNKKNSMGNQ